MKKTKRAELSSRVFFKIPMVVAWTAIVMGIVYYLALPVISLQSGGFWWFAIITLLVFAIGLVAMHWSSEDEDGAERVSKVGIGVIAAVFIIFCFMGICSSKMVNSRRYQEIMPVETANFTENFTDITDEDNTQTIAIVDLETAKMVGNRTIGNISNSSWYEVDSEFNLIEYQGKYYRISPLNYGGFFKYNKAKNNGLPGFVLVDSETAQAQFVEVEGGYFYSPSAYWNKDLRRHLRTCFPNDLIFESYFEVDDDGNPYWISPVYESTISAFGGRKQVAVVITDAVNGHNTKYQLDQIPEWVDHCYSLSYLVNNTQYHYSYVSGFWNSVFSQTGVYKLAYMYRSDKADGEYFEGYTSLIGQDGDVYFYSGLTPANSSESNAGFVVMNTRTGQVTQFDYSQSNAAEESSAQCSSESLVQNFGYQATFPIIINVNGQETYLMTLKDKAGLVQRYSLCNILNYSLVVEAETLDDALKEYLVKIGTDTNIAIDESQEKLNKTAQIENVYTAQIEGTTYFYYQFKGDQMLYKASITVSELQVTLKTGSKVSIEYVEGKDISTITHIEF